jgi:hypothetical protein
MDKCTAEKHPAMLRYNLRLRQVVAAAAADIEIQLGYSLRYSWAAAADIEIQLGYWGGCVATVS